MFHILVQYKDNATDTLVDIFPQNLRIRIKIFKGESPLGNSSSSTEKAILWSNGVR